MEALLIDVFESCRLRESREGDYAVADLPRLAEESVDKAGSIRWSFVGGMNELGHPQLSLAVSGAVQLICQRCLTPFKLAIESQSILVLATDEASADHIETVLDDESVEVIVATRQFNLTDLIEDEALLSIPVSPKHEVCPDHAKPIELKHVDKAPSPFDVLKKLKK